ncbi:MAG: glycosyltransferase [Caulobacteraceae bacterium]|nr:glycosyltransferase [Caulobacteraceae bacterium]
MTGGRNDASRAASPNSAPKVNPDIAEEAARLRAENAELTRRLSRLEARADGLEGQLGQALHAIEDQRQSRRALDREIVEMRSLLAEAERQLGNVRQTFIYRIGEAIVSARTWKGLRSLPRRLIALRRAYREKRGNAGPSVENRQRVSQRLRYVEEAVNVLSNHGLDAAGAHVRGMPERHAEEKARALVELALAGLADHPGRAGGLGLEAAGLNPREPRLRALVMALFDHGQVMAPADLLAKMDGGLMSSPADLARRDVILAHRSQLVAPMAPPPRAADRPGGRPRLAVVTPRASPQHGDAVALRAQAVLRAADDAGIEAFLVTPPGYQYPANGNGSPVLETVGTATAVRLAPSDASLEAFDAFVSETSGNLARVFARRHITHVHAMAGTPLATAALWAARAKGAKTTLDVAAAPAFGDRTGPSWEASERFCSGLSLFAETLGAADQVIVRSKAVADELVERRLIDHPMIIEDALPDDLALAPAESVNEVRHELGLSDQRLIGVFEAIDDDEGLADLVRALPAIHKAEPRAAVFFCGAGKGSANLVRLAARLGVADHVFIPTGFVRGRTADYLSAFSVAAFPKRRALSRGLSAAFELQAVLAVGAPVVATDTTWARDWINPGITGLAVEPADVDGLAEAIVRVLGDADLAGALGHAGRVLVLSRTRRAVIDPRILATLDGPSGRAAA